jgi:hypothetical protein
MPLSWAAENMQETVIQALLENGADIDESKDRVGRRHCHGRPGLAVLQLSRCCLKTARTFNRGLAIVAHHCLGRLKVDIGAAGDHRPSTDRTWRQYQVEG